MTPAEDLVLAMATILTAMVFVEGAKGTLTHRAAALLSALAMLAAVAVLLHMSIR